MTVSGSYVRGVIDYRRPQQRGECDNCDALVMIEGVMVGIVNLSTQEARTFGYVEEGKYLTLNYYGACFRGHRWPTLMATTEAPQ